MTGLYATIGIQAALAERQRSGLGQQVDLALLEDAAVPAGPISSVAEVFAEPQIQARQMQVTVPHPQNPQLQLVGNPIKLSRTPVEYGDPPPTLGQHTEEVLAGLS